MLQAIHRNSSIQQKSDVDRRNEDCRIHSSWRPLILAYDGGGKGQRATRDDSGKYQRIPDDMNYRDWKAVYIDKSKTLETWRAESKLAAGQLPTAASGAKVAATKSALDEAAIRAKLEAVKSELKIKGELIYPPPRFDLSAFKFDAIHTQGDKHSHAVTEQEARQFIEDAYFAIAKRGANSYNYWGKNGATYVQPNLKRIRTAFKSEEYAPPYRKLIEVFEDARSNT